MRLGRKGSRISGPQAGWVRKAETCSDGDPGGQEYTLLQLTIACRLTTAKILEGSGPHALTLGSMDGIQGVCGLGREKNNIFTSDNS